MNFKNYFMIFALFFVLTCSVGAISAVSNDTMENIASEIDFDNSISLPNEEEAVAIDDNDAIVSTQMNDNESISQSLDDNSNILSKNVPESDGILKAAKSSKSDLKIVNYTNFVKSGNTCYFYLTDLNGKKIPNKDLTISFNGKNYAKTTNSNGRVGINVKSSASSSSMKITFKGDDKYNAFSKTLKFYIDQSISMTIGNSKLLTNGYLRIYMSGPKDSISGKTLKITVGNKKFTRTTSSEGFVVLKPKVAANKKYTVSATYGKYVVSKRIKCIAGNVISPFVKSIPMVNGMPDIDVMPSTYVMADDDGKFTLEKSQYQETIKRDSYFLFLYGKLSKYTFFKTKDCPATKHIIKREKWNVIERALNTKLVKKNKYEYWPDSITVSVKGKSYTYSEVRDTQNTGYTCGPTSASVCSQALRNFHSEKFFQEEAHVTDGVNIPVLKSALERNGFKASYYYTVDDGVRQLAKGGVALIAFLPNHYVSIIDVSPDSKKILVSNSYGDYDVGGDSRVPTDWVSVSYFKSKFEGVGLVVKLNYKIGDSKKAQLNYLYNSMGANWIRQNVNERIPDVGL